MKTAYVSIATGGIHTVRDVERIEVNSYSVTFVQSDGSTLSFPLYKVRHWTTVKQAIGAK